MRCEEVLTQLNARADGELRAQEAAGLESHLAECSQCRAAAESLQTIDAELRRAFQPERAAAARLAQTATAAIRALDLTPVPATPQLASSHRTAWAQLLVGLAAGFLLAVALFRPWQPRFVAPVSVPQPQPFARLAVASGPVEVQDASQLTQCAAGAPISSDSIVRTGANDRCEISLPSGNALRLDCNTEVKLLKSEVVEVSRGRLSSTSPAGGKGLEIKMFGCPIMAQPAAQLAVDCQPEALRLIVVDGTAHVPRGQETIAVGPNKQVWIVDGKVTNDPEWCDTSLETAWVNSVLALSDSDHPELVQRVNQLLANVGAAKLSLLYEDELRRLGDAGVPPLLAYLSSTRETPNLAERATAARIIADVAETRWIGDLIALLTDANAQVRVHAARGLERLTGRDQGLQAVAWQTSSWLTCEPPYQKWLDWWKENRDRYPAARRDIPAPLAPPF